MRPKSLDIRAEAVRLWDGGPEQRCLVGRDGDGVDWLIRWCGNGSHSHWVVCRLADRKKDGSYKGGYYLFAHPRPHYSNEDLIRQIEVAEKKYGIYT